MSRPGFNYEQHLKDYEKQCRDFHENRYTVTDSAWHKMLKGDISSMTPDELEITTQALQYYLQKSF